MFGFDFNLGDIVSNIGSWIGKGDNLIDLGQIGLATAGALGSRDPEVPYGQTEAAFNAEMALKKDELAQRLAIAQLQAGAAGAGSGAAIAAAKIAAASAMAQLKEKLAADAIMKRIELGQQGPINLFNAGQSVVNALQNRGQASQNGFNQMANVLAGARR